MDSIRSPGKLLILYLESTWSPSGVHLESTWSPPGPLLSGAIVCCSRILLDSMYTPGILHLESRWSPQGVVLFQDSWKNPSTVKLDFVWTPRTIPLTCQIKFIIAKKSNVFHGIQTIDLLHASMIDATLN